MTRDPHTMQRQAQAGTTAGGAGVVSGGGGGMVGGMAVGWTMGFLTGMVVGLRRGESKGIYLGMQTRIGQSQTRSQGMGRRLLAALRTARRVR